MVLYPAGVRSGTPPPSHRPWPVPERRWSIFMRWHDLAFLHWPVLAEMLRPHVPTGLELDVFQGQAWIGIVPFHMSAIRHRLLYPIPGASAFPELNVRTYVVAQNRQGVWFFSLDAANSLAVLVARWLFHLNYQDARILCCREGDGVRFSSRRVQRGACRAEFVACYRPVGKIYQARRDSLDYWLTERYCMYMADSRGKLLRGEIAHAPWELQRAQVVIDANSMADTLGLPLAAPPVLCHFAACQETVAWTPDSVTTGRVQHPAPVLKNERDKPARHALLAGEENPR